MHFKLVYAGHKVSFWCSANVGLLLGKQWSDGYTHTQSGVSLQLVQSAPPHTPIFQSCDGATQDTTSHSPTPKIAHSSQYDVGELTEKRYHIRKPSIKASSSNRAFLTLRKLQRQCKAGFMVTVRIIQCVCTCGGHTSSSLANSSPVVMVSYSSSSLLPANSAAMPYTSTQCTVSHSTQHTVTHSNSDSQHTVHSTVQQWYCLGKDHLIIR